MKRFVVVKYYNFLMFLEDVIGGVENFIHKHRVKIDEKYW